MIFYTFETSCRILYKHPELFPLAASEELPEKGSTKTVGNGNPEDPLHHTSVNRLSRIINGDRRIGTKQKA